MPVRFASFNKSTETIVGGNADIVVITDFSGSMKKAINNVYSKDEDKKRRGPMAKAFLVTNPMIPQEYFRPKGIDPFVERMQRDGGPP